jgi:uncharacterized iron-regulated membrane protein
MVKNRKGYSIRNFINDVHLWLGVASAIVLFLVCLSGTVYTFKHEIDRAVEPEKFYVASENEPLSISEIIKATAETTSGKVTRVTVYDNPNQPFELQVSASKEDKRGETYFVDQYNNAILGTGKGSTSEFFMFFFKMHRWLLLDQEIGRPIVGIATLIFVILTLTGLVLWFPKKVRGFKSFKSGLRIKTGGSWKRINHDLHNVLGFYTFLIVLVMALTGLNWSFEWYKDASSTVLGAKVFGGRDEKKMFSDSTAISARLSVEDVLAVSSKALPYTGKTSVSLPKGKGGTFEIRKFNESKFNKDATDKLVVDQYSGKILKKELFDDKTSGQKIAAQIKSIHTGEIYGMTSKVIYFISCLIATSLPVTGVIIWINKLRKKSKKRATKRPATI